MKFLNEEDYITNMLGFYSVWLVCLFVFHGSFWLCRMSPGLLASGKITANISIFQSLLFFILPLIPESGV